jgi:DHA2 family methylenomycin A resistance protein-like MFS transporter
VVADRFGVGPVLTVGLVVIGASALLFALLPASGGLVVLGLALVLSGAGQAFVFTLSNVAAVDARPGATGLESGLINAVRQVGALVGLAVLGAIFAGLQRQAGGSSSTAFVASLRPPSVLLAATCIATAHLARGIRPSAPASR